MSSGDCLGQPDKISIKVEGGGGGGGRKLIFDEQATYLWVGGGSNRPGTSSFDPNHCGRSVL